MASEGNRNGLSGMLVLRVGPEEQKVGARNGKPKSKREWNTNAMEQSRATVENDF